VQTTDRLIRNLALLTFAFAGVVSIAVNAEEAQPPGVLETFTCSYNAGKDIDDVLAARDYYVKQAAKAGVDIGPAYLWTLIKGDLPFDAVWLAPHQNLGAYAASADAQAAAPELSDVLARFNSAVTCTPRLGTTRTVFQREVPDRADAPAIVTAFACGVREGVTPVGIADLEGHIADVLGGMEDNAPNVVFSLTPTTGGANTPDWLLFSVFDSMTSWANFVGGLFSSDAGQQLVRHLNAVADCDQAIWGSQRVIAPPASE